MYVCAGLTKLILFELNFIENNVNKMSRLAVVVAVVAAFAVAVAAGALVAASPHAESEE